MLTNYVPKQKQVSGKAVAHNFRNRYIDEEELQKPDASYLAEQNKNLTEKYAGLVSAKHKQAHQNISGQSKQSEAQYIRYTPKNAGSSTNSTARQRIVKMHKVVEDPLNPGGFKAKKVAGSTGSPPKTVMHSPPKKVTGQDMLDWKIPPCVSNWKNSKGYTIPLEMRLKADGRTLQQHTVSERHSELTNALYIAERVSRQELKERNNIHKTMTHKDNIQKEEQIRREAKKALEERNKLMEEQEIDNDNLLSKRKDPVQEMQMKVEEEEVQMRQTMKYANKRELEREQRLQYAGNKKAKQVRDQERDISEKVALGQAQANTGKSEVQFDNRLFNQTGGLESGFGGDDDENRLYDKPLFQDRTAANIYKNVRQDEEEDGRTKQGLERILNAKKRGFESTEDKGGSRTKPVEFQKHQDHAFTASSQNPGDEIVKKVKRN